MTASSPRTSAGPAEHWPLSLCRIVYYAFSKYTVLYCTLDAVLYYLILDYTIVYFNIQYYTIIQAYNIVYNILLYSTTYLPSYLSIHLSIYVHTYLLTCLHTCLRTYIHTYIRMYTNMCIYIYIYMRVCMYKTTYICSIPAEQWPCSPGVLEEEGTWRFGPRRESHPSRPRPS